MKKRARCRESVCDQGCITIPLSLSVMILDVFFRPPFLCLTLRGVWAIGGMERLSLAAMAASEGMCLHIRLVAWYVNAACWKGIGEICFIVRSSHSVFPFMLSTIVSTERASCKPPVAFGRLNPQRRPMLWKICMFYRVIGSFALVCFLCCRHRAVDTIYIYYNYVKIVTMYVFWVQSLGLVYLVWGEKEDNS